MSPKALERLLTLPGREPKRKRPRERRVTAIEVVDGETGEVVKTLDVRHRSSRDIERIDSGLNINLNHDRYFTRQQEA